MGAVAGGGVFIAFEGGEGAGKSTQVQRLQEWLTNEGLVARTTFEPGATAIGAASASIVLDPAHTRASSPRSEALLYAADRAQHVHDVLRPALDAGEVVITDRFVDSSLAYQGAGRTIPLDDVRMLSRWATEGLQPDLTVLLDLPPEVGLARARGPGGGRPAGVGVAGVPPAGAAHLPAAGRGEPDRYLVLDAGSADEIAASSGPVADCCPACRCRDPQSDRGHRPTMPVRATRTPRPARPRSCTRERRRERGSGRDVIGQPAVVAELRAAVANPAAMTHAWLFTGPPGSGRSVAARAFAAALQCPARRRRHLPRLPDGARPARTPTSGWSCPRGCRSASTRCASWCGWPAGRRPRAAGRWSSSRTPTG